MDSNSKRELDKSPYDHDAWFFGAGGTIPSWAGYSIGFEQVKKYLQRQPSRLPLDLHDEAAVSFEMD